MTSLKIHLLGPVEILADQTALKIPRKIERVLLCYLAAENHPVNRTTLIDLLWPEAQQIDPRAALRTALSRLRKQLPDANLIMTELDQVSLDTQYVYVDMLKFRESFLGLRNILSALPEHNPLPKQIANQIKDVLTLWRGDHLIQGDDLTSYPEFESWRRNKSRELASQREFLIRRLAVHLQATGQPELALDLFIQLGRMNYQDLSNHLAVFDLLTKLGRHQEALEYCDALEVIFERQSNAPLPEQIISRCRHTQLMIQTSDQHVTIEWPAPSSTHIPLIGRTSALDQLRQAYYRGGVVRIQGEMGTGKTRLVEELFSILSPKPMLIMATARENETILPLAVIINAFRRHIPELSWREVDHVWALQLTRLFPELTEIRTDCSLDLVNKLSSTRQHLFDALHQLLLLIGKRFGRVLFFVDNAHWVDDQTLQVLLYLVSQGFFKEHGVLILATESGSSDSGIEKTFSQIQHDHLVQVIDLPGLNLDELRTLSEQVLLQPLSRTLIEQLYRETNGNPFIALEILKHLLELSLDEQGFQTLERFPLPESIQGLFQRRLKQLSDTAYLILACAAVIESDISVKLLQTVSNVDDNEFLNALDSLIRAGLMRIVENNAKIAGSVFFTHEKIRELVIKEATPAYLHILHQRAAGHLSQTQQKLEKAGVIANHYLASGDVKNAFRWYLHAAEHAWSLGANTDVDRTYQQAEQLINTAIEGTFNPADVLLLYQHWSDYAFKAAQVDRLEEVGVKLQYFGEKFSDTVMMGVSNLALSNACFLREDYETCMFLSEKAVSDLEKTDQQVELLQALFHQAILLWWTLDYEKILLTTERMERLIQNLDPQSPLRVTFAFNAKRMISEAYYGQGQAERAFEIAQETYLCYFPKLDIFDRLRALNLQAYTHFIVGHVEKSIHFANEGLKIAQALDRSFIQELLLIILCKAEIEMGFLDDAYRHATLLQALAERNHKIQTIVSTNTLFGNIFISLNNLPQAIHYYRIAQIRQGFTFQSFNGLENNIRLAYLLIRSGHEKDAKELIRTSLAVTEEKGMMFLHVQALMADGLIDLTSQDYLAAEEKFNTALEIAEQRGLSHQIIWGKFHLALLAFHQEHFDLAEKCLFEVLAQAKAKQMSILLQFALDLAVQLSRHISLEIHRDELQAACQALIDSLEVHTQSEPLRQDFLKMQRSWGICELLP